MAYNNIFTSFQNISNVSPKAGGFCWAVLCKWEEVLNWPSLHPVTGLVEDELELKPGSTFYRLQGMEKDRFYKENDKQTDAGTMTASQVQALIAGSSNPVLLVLQQMRFHQWVIILQDRSGQIRLIGNEDAAAFCLRNYDTGDVDGTRIYSLQFGFESQLPPPVYKPTTVLIDGSSISILPTYTTPGAGGIGTMIIESTFVVA